MRAPTIRSLTDWTDNHPDENPWHPVHTIEPLPDSDPGDEKAVEALTKVFLLLLPQSEENIAERLSAGWTRFVGLAQIVRPDLLGGCSQTFIANLMGLTSAALSKQTVLLSKQLGMLGRGQRSLAARESYRRGQLNRRSTGTREGPKDIMQRHVEAVEKGCRTARRKFLGGCENFSKFEILSLLEHGLIDDDHATLTEEGMQFMETGELPQEATGAQAGSSGMRYRKHISRPATATV
jgi:predicted transcriptional regulator